MWKKEYYVEHIHPPSASCPSHRNQGQDPSRSAERNDLFKHLALQCKELRSLENVHVQCLTVDLFSPVFTEMKSLEMRGVSLAPFCTPLPVLPSYSRLHGRTSSHCLKVGLATGSHSQPQWDEHTVCACLSAVAYLLSYILFFSHFRVRPFRSHTYS